MAVQKLFTPFFKWLFLPIILQRASRRKGPPANDNTVHAGATQDRALFLHGRGEYRYESVKSSQYQAELGEIAKRKPRAETRHECIANLVLDDCNSNDRNRVVIAIEDTITGAFPRSLSTQYREWLQRWHLSNAVVKCRAVIVTGAGHGRGGREDYRVKLDIEVPFRMTVE